MGLSLDGLASGLDTTALIRALMDVESLPQLQLKKKVNTSQILTATLQNLNSKIAALGDTAKGLATPGALALYTATSSSESVTATATAGASSAELDFTVAKTAERHSAVTAAMSSWGSDTALTITAADGTTIQVPTTGSLDDIVSAVNASEAGVTATKVSAGTDAFTGDPAYRLQFTSKETGAASAFQVHRSSGLDLFAEDGAAVFQTGQDAEIVLYAGTNAVQTISSATNTFADVLPGVSITVSETTTVPVTLTVAPDDKAVSVKTEEFAKSLNGIFNYIKAQTAVTTGTTATGGATTSGGVLLGDSTVRMANTQIMKAATDPVDGKSPSEFGFVITKDGTIKFDAEKFATAMAADPVAVQAALQTIAGRVEEAAVNLSDKYDGLITSKITGQEKLARSLNDQILDWDKRLATREATLKKIYSGLEVMMSNMNSQMSYLQSQIAGLPSASGNNSNS